MDPSKNLTLTLLLLSLAFSKSCGQSLRAVYIDDKLPFAADFVSPLYDGDDIIYILGGSSGTPYRSEILTFTISTSTIEVAGRMPGIGQNGKAHYDSNGFIIYIGGGSDHDQVYKFDTTLNQTSVTGSVTDMYGTASVLKVDNSNTVYIFGGGPGSQNKIRTFELDTFNNTIEVGTLPATYARIAATRLGTKAYILGSGTRSILELDLETLETRSDLDFATSTELTPTLVNDGKYVYVIGGIQPSLPFPSNAIIQIDPEAFDWTLYQIEGLVNGEDYFKAAPAAVYVEKLNRIYFFGGWSYDAGYHDDIFYVDISPISTPTPPTTTTVPTTTPESATTIHPDIFNCDNRTDGNYPNPYDCAQFVGCHNGTVEYYTCPPPLLFNPIPLTRRGCELPHLVDCQLNCADRVDGKYPHPHDCSLFIYCYEEELSVYKCPPPLLFDAVLLDCIFPEVAQCVEVEQ